MRNLGEHLDDYVLRTRNMRHKEVSRRQLFVARWSSKGFEWVGQSIGFVEAFAAAEHLWMEARACRGY